MKSVKSAEKRRLILDLIFAAVLILYPLRHVHWGLDLWDTGYSYANYIYMGTEHMDPMWLFSTYLATAAGHLISMLPGGGRMIGMNCYTSLFLSGMAAGGYFFCTRKLGISRTLSFVGEMAALSLCWCPSASLYNYLTYVLFLLGVILLYNGLTKDNAWFLFAAGICLGSNVLVRFSNLTEAGMIAAVWAWDFILWRESGRGSAAPSGGRVSFWRLAVRHTLWCLGGYLAALAGWFAYIHIRYGLNNYIAGIQRLFGMTDHAADYKPASMLTGMVGSYVEGLYWAGRIGLITVAGMAAFALAEPVFRRIGGKLAGILRLTVKLGWCGVAVLMVVWLYVRGFCVAEFWHYGAILWPGVLFLMLALLIGGVRIFHPGSTREERLISGIVVLVVLLTSLGSNNKLYPSMNNLFVAAPYVLWQSWRFVRRAGDRSLAGNRLVISSFPVKAILTAFLGVALFQFYGFGAGFVFAEATGVQNVTAVIENNEILRGIRMNPQRAKELGEINDYAAEHDFQGREVILYGEIPGLSYYLQMPSAFNPWSDLRSYGSQVMETDLAEVAAEIESGAGEHPVIILEKSWALYLEGGESALRQAGTAESQIDKIMEREAKNQLLRDFMEQYHYVLTFHNEKFWVYEGA